MKKNHQSFSKLHKMQALNNERIHELNLEHDFILGLDQAISHSKLHHRKSNVKYTRRLSKALGRIEHARDLQQQRDPTIPDLDPNTSVLIGYCVRSKTAYSISLSNLLMHILICGCSGSGKSTLINLILHGLTGKVPVTFFDHKDEGLRFANNYSESLYAPIEHQRWNCLKARGDQGTYIRFVSTILARIMALVPTTANALQAKLIALCANPDDLPSLTDLAQAFRKLAQSEGRSVLHTAARALDDLANALGAWSQVRKGAWPFDHPGMTIIPLKGIPAAIENFYVTLFVTQLMDGFIDSGHVAELSHALVFDEARQLFGLEFAATTGSGRSNIQTQLMTQARSYGILSLLGTQSGNMLQPSVVDNSATFIALRTNSETEAKFCCRRLGLPDRFYTRFLELPIGHAWITSPTCRTPVEIKIPYRELGEYPSVGQISSRMAPIWKAWDAQTIFSPSYENTETIDFREILGERTPSQNVPAEDSVASEVISEPKVSQVLEEEFTLLQSCKDFPNYGSSEHYKHLGWSAGRGNRVKGNLLESRWIETVRVASPNGGRPRITLHLTILGEKIINEHA